LNALQSGRVIRGSGAFTEELIKMLNQQLPGWSDTIDEREAQFDRVEASKSKHKAKREIKRRGRKPAW
jgi:hypothetical protein